MMRKILTTPSVSYSFTIRLSYPNRVGMFARIVSAIGRHGGDLGAVDIVTPDAKVMTRDISVCAHDGAHQDALNVRARQITEEMKQAAAHAIAGCISPRELNAEYIVPSVFNRDVVQRVADAVQRAAIKTGVARRKK